MTALELLDHGLGSAFTDLQTLLTALLSAAVTWAGAEKRLPACLPACPSVLLSSCLSACPSARLSMCLMCVCDYDCV